MHAFRKNRRIALLIVAALLFASTLFPAHGYGDGSGAHSSVQCDLCLQFTGTAAAPAAASSTLAAIQCSLVAIVAARPAPAACRNVDSRLPRGPPATQSA